MNLKFGLTDGPVNTYYAPLAALIAHYQEQQILKALENVEIPMKSRDFSVLDKLNQILVSILSGCETLSEVNIRLKTEAQLARVGHWKRFADQSTLSRTLDALTLKQTDLLRKAVITIGRTCGRTVHHNWRSYLWLDFDLSGLPCGKQAEASQKGYFSGKKTRRDVS